MIGPMDTSSGDPRQLELDLGENVRGRYSNVAVITHTATEVVLDFAAMMPGMPKPQVVSRIVLTPEHAKRLLAALGQNIARYEERFGPIKTPGQAPSSPSA